MGSSIRFGLAPAALAGLLALGACKPPPAVKAPPPASSAPASGPDADGARAFLEGLYAHYQSGTNNSFQMFDKDETAVFDADTIRLLADDTRALKGELGEIDGDWLCNCQDFTRLQATIAVQSATSTTARATADFHDTGDPIRAPDHAGFDLVKSGGAWRIHDITLRGEPLSLRATLQKEIADLAHGASTVSGPKRTGDEAP
jgi:hypothetical protein